VIDFSQRGGNCIEYETSQRCLGARGVETNQGEIMTRNVLAIAALAAIVCLCTPVSQAQAYGNAPWCAVRNIGTGEVEWDCEYYSAAECAPTVVAGNRGFCNENPYFVSAPPPVTPWRPRHHRRYLRHP
jgi:hypothetical protein